MYEGDIEKDIWSANIPKSYVDNVLVSDKKRRYAAHNSRMAGLSRISRRSHKIDNEREHINPALHLVEGS